MDKHTFKVGDRVFGQVCTDDKKVPGVFVKMGGYMAKGCIIRRDDGVSGIEPGLFWFADYLTTHDTDFQVGDWVRYEGIHPRVVSPLLEGKIGQIDYLSGDSCAGISQFHMQSGGIVYKTNLVKIQPPQEEEKMDIMRKSNGSILPGVVSTDVPSDGWKYIPKDRSYVVFYPKEHWEPVEEWVKIEVRKSQWEIINTQIGTFEAWGLDGNYHTVSWRPVK